MFKILGIRDVASATSQVVPMLSPHILWSINSPLLILHMLLSLAKQVFISPIRPKKHMLTDTLLEHISLLHLLRHPKSSLPSFLLLCTSLLWYLLCWLFYNFSFSSSRPSFLKGGILILLSSFVSVAPSTLSSTHQSFKNIHQGWVTVAQASNS